ncbi:hypothetical protein GCM10022380_55590 [Amycolatopsis tucumanensis]|uniref:Uncharacterized protein n=1 Tax=Amycolatopsis tucumanensis TaxID=401106 RepID=A0ABP7IXY9_9PSEU
MGVEAIGCRDEREAGQMPLTTNFSGHPGDEFSPTVSGTERLHVTLRAVAGPLSSVTYLTIRKAGQACDTLPGNVPQCPPEPHRGLTRPLELHDPAPYLVIYCHPFGYPLRHRE